MKHISVKMSDADYKRLGEERGDKSISEHVRMLIFTHRKEAESESAAFQQLFKDVTLIKGLLSGSLTDLATKKDLLALARFIVEVATTGDPLSYSHEQTKIQQFFQTLASKMQSEG
jgi:predicted CopG family antitoxin